MIGNQYITLVSNKKLAKILPLCTIPEEVLQQSLGHYQRNQFAQLLRSHFGLGVANDLLRRFEVGTSSHWPGATIFWQRDAAGKVRGGQVVLFDANGHTAKISAKVRSPAAALPGCIRRARLATESSIANSRCGYQTTRTPPTVWRSRRLFMAWCRLQTEPTGPAGGNCGSTKNRHFVHPLLPGFYLAGRGGPYLPKCSAATTREAAPHYPLPRRIYQRHSLQEMAR